MPNPKVLVATAADGPVLYSILCENAAWLKAKGIDQWAKLKPEAAFTADLERGLVFKIMLYDAVAGTVTLTPDKDPYWPDDWTNNAVSAVYLHRFGIAVRFKGRKLGSNVIKWAKQETRRRKFDLLRLDCVNHNAVLIAYYTALGFEDKGVSRYGEREYRLFEKRVRDGV